MSMNASNIIAVIPSCLSFVACLALAGCGAAASGSEQTDPIASESDLLSSKCPPPVDPSIAVPDGNRLAFQFDAVGVQIYACQASATGAAWVFTAPEADLLNKHGKVVGRHFAGPTWEAKDGSQVVGARIAGVTPDASAIPWLLLGATSHVGDGLLSTVSYIQRLDTVGGIAPSADACTVDHVGESARVPYTATYFFYEAGKACHCP